MVQYIHGSWFWPGSSGRSRTLTAASPGRPGRASDRFMGPTPLKKNTVPGRRVFMTPHFSSGPSRFRDASRIAPYRRPRIGEPLARSPFRLARTVCSPPPGPITGCYIQTKNPPRAGTGSERGSPTISENTGPCFLMRGRGPFWMPGSRSIMKDNIPIARRETP